MGGDAGIPRDCSSFLVAFSPDVWTLAMTRARTVSVVRRRMLHSAKTYRRRRRAPNGSSASHKAHSARFSKSRHSPFVADPVYLCRSCSSANSRSRCKCTFSRITPCSSNVVGFGAGFRQRRRPCEDAGLELSVRSEVILVASSAAAVESLYYPTLMVITSASIAVDFLSNETMVSTSSGPLP